MLGKSKQWKKLQEYYANDRENEQKSPMKMPATQLLKLLYTYVNITPQISTSGGGLGLIFNLMERLSAMQNMNFSSHWSQSGSEVLTAKRTPRPSLIKPMRWEATWQPWEQPDFTLSSSHLKTPAYTGREPRAGTLPSPALHHSSHLLPCPRWAVRSFIFTSELE